MSAPRRVPLAPGEPPPRPLVPALLALGGTCVLLGIAVASLWYQDWRYSLPTPRPPDLAQPPAGAPIRVDDLPGVLRTGGRPLWLHFTSSECPCSDFVAEHVRELAREFGRVRCLAVEEGEDRSGDELGLPSLADADGAIASRFGVYSTPQAVLLAADGTLWYRGNYNSSRYCSDGRSAFVRQALTALVSGAPRPAFPPSATLAYGCELARTEDGP